MVQMNDSKQSEQDDERRLLAQKIASCQAIWTQVWHGGAAGAASDPLMALVQEQHRRNFDLWHEEDKTRAPDATDGEIATVKRAIDKLNQQRNDLVEKIDDFLFAAIASAGAAPADDAPWNSETPGSIVDKLSILSLKVYHMREQAERLDASAEHVKKCRERLATLNRQLADLTSALSALFEDLYAGRKQMKLYRQFKMYNDPSLNPSIYNAKKPEN